MSAQHTPGPWEQEAFQDDPTNNPHYHPDRIIRAPDMAMLCRVQTHPRVGAERARANARLIVAAPDMLAALTDWIEWLKPDSPWREDAAAHEEQMLAAMRAAIAKATGGEA